MAGVPHLEKLNKEFRDRGFEIIAVSDEDAGTIESKLIKARNVSYGVVSADIKQLYANPGIPHAWVLDPEGKCIWRGHPAGVKSEMVEEWVKDLPPTRVGREVARELNGAARAYDKGEIGKAMTDALKVADSATEETVKADAAYILEICAKHVKLTEAKLARAGEDLVAKVKVLEDGAARFKGSETGSKWEAEAKELKKSKPYKDCIAAADELAKIKPVLDDLRPAAAKRRLEAIAKKYPDTPAGKEAAELAGKYTE